MGVNRFKTTGLYTPPAIKLATCERSAIKQKLLPCFSKKLAKVTPAKPPPIIIKSYIPMCSYCICETAAIPSLAESKLTTLPILKTSAVAIVKVSV